MVIPSLREMSPEARQLKAFELSEFSKRLFLHGLHKRFPELSQEDIRKIYNVGIQYMVTGSAASSLQGEPRSTHDIDLVIAIEKKQQISWQTPFLNQILLR